MPKSLKISFFLISFFYFSCKKVTPEVVVPPIDTTPPAPAKEMVIDLDKIVWGDEFSKDGALNTTLWGYDIGGGGWGNNEEQYYTNTTNNARVENGSLIIEAKKERIENSNYSSARVISKNKGDFTYGRFEIKAKLPKGVGTWPAIWMLATETSFGTIYWPDNGEIDIMEHVGYDQNVVHANIHTKSFNHSIGTNKGNGVNVPNASEDFHVYACNWLPNSMTFEVDGVVYFTFNKETNYNWPEWPFDKKFHLLMNIAVGGSWGGQKGIDDSIYPQKMVVDYVRVYGIKEK